MLCPPASVAGKVPGAVHKGCFLRSVLSLCPCFRGCLRPRAQQGRDEFLAVAELFTIGSCRARCGITLTRVIRQGKMLAGVTQVVGPFERIL